MPDKTIRMMLAVAMLSLVALGVMSCQKTVSPASTEAPKLIEPKYSGALEKEKHDSRILTMRCERLSSEEVKKLEEEIQANPEDLTSRMRVLGWYSRSGFCSESARRVRYKHILWFIQNHPDNQIAATYEFYLDPVLDKEVYYKAKDLWLEQTEAHKTNATVLGNAAKFLLIHDNAIAEEFLRKAQALEPENPEWPEQLGYLYERELVNNSAEQKRELASRALKQFEKSSAKTLSERERFYKLADLAKTAYEAGDLRKAENYANELLAQAARYTDDWNYGSAIHHGNLVLGRVALQSGDPGKARQYLIKAGQAPGSPQLDSFGPNMALAKELLEKNEREVVIQYLELCGKFWKTGQDDLKEWTALVREGRIPDFRANLVY